MKNKKILSAGCSLVYGAELSDCPSYNGIGDPSLKTWPSLVANKLGYEYYTCSLCGISNQGITRHVIDVCERYDFDLLIIQWTFRTRYELRFNKEYGHFNEPSPYCNVDPWMTDFFPGFELWPLQKKQECRQTQKNLPNEIIKAANFWFTDIDSNETQIYNFYKSSTELATYLKWKNIPFVFASAETDPSFEEIESINDVSIFSLYNIYNTMPVINFDGKGFYNWAQDNKFPFGLDHPKDLAHSKATDLVLDQIQNFL